VIGDPFVREVTAPSEAFDILLDTFNAKYTDLWEVSGARHIDIKRLASSTSAGVGQTPTDTHASGLTNLRAIIGSPFDRAQRPGPVEYPATQLRWIELFNIELHISDLIIIDDVTYNILSISKTAPLTKCYYISGAAFTLTGNAPATVSRLCCALSAKPDTAISFKLTYLDYGSVVRSSDLITFPADCTLDEFHIIVANAVAFPIQSISAVIDVSGTMGSGSLYISAHVPFSTYATISETG
jgi:hypothetical protein